MAPKAKEPGAVGEGGRGEEVRKSRHRAMKLVCKKRLNFSHRREDFTE